MKHFPGFPVLGLILVGVQCAAGGWVTWRGDPARSGATTAVLPVRPSLSWCRDFPAPEPAWDDPRLRFDWTPRLAVAHGQVLVPSSSRDCIYALDAASGATRWIFRTGAPVRTPPFVDGEQLYIAADDGLLYCLSTTSGRELWRYSGALDRRRVIGNDRVISAWPARGGPVAAGGRIWFTSGIWPFMGVSAYCLEAKTGRLLWRNDRIGSLYGPHTDRTATAFGGASPQGPLALAGGRLIVPGSRAYPYVLDADTGRLQPYSSGTKGTLGPAGSLIGAAGSFLLAGGVVIEQESRLAIGFNPERPQVLPFACLPVISDGVLYAARGKTVKAFDLGGGTFEKTYGVAGWPFLECRTRELWSAPTPQSATSMILVGKRLVVGCSGAVLVFSVDPAAATNERLLWKETIEGIPGDLAADEGRLFVATREGRIYAFDNDRGKSVPAKIHKTDSQFPAPIDASIKQRAADLIKLPDDPTLGRILVLGADSSGLIEALLAVTSQRVVVQDVSPERARALRIRLEQSGMYGSRVDICVGRLATLELPACLAGLIVCATPESKRQLLERSDEQLPVLHRLLRPYGGVLALRLDAKERKIITASARRCTLEGMEIETRDGWTVLRRRGALPGAADWTHEAADCGNTWMSADRLRPPLGTLWYGGPSGAAKLYPDTHSSSPTPRVAGGRMFLTGRGAITAVDIFTGRVIWRKRYPRSKPVSTVRAFGRGGRFASMRGTGNLQPQTVALPGAFYIAYGNKLECWNPADGKKRSAFQPQTDTDTPDYFGYIRVCDDVLVAGADYDRRDIGSQFLPADLRDVDESRVAALIASLKQWPELAGEAPKPGEKKRAFALRLLNRLLCEKTLDRALPQTLREHILGDREQKAKLDAAVKELQHFQQRLTYAFLPYQSLESCNRRVLEACYPEIRPAPPILFWHNLAPWDGLYTRRLVGLDRKTGHRLWACPARASFPQEGVALGNGLVFAIDRMDEDVAAFRRHRGLSPPPPGRLFALDLHTGEKRWERPRDVPGYHLMYSRTHDVLVLVRPHDPDPALHLRKARPQTCRFLALRGRDGRELWDRTVTFERKSGAHRMWYDWILHDRTIILESYFDTHSDYYGFDLFTGEPRKRICPLTGKSLPWGFRRTRGCTKNLCSANLVFFRSSDAGYFDIAGDGGTGNFGGFRPGCKISLIPADGLLNAPNFASGCTCSYPVLTSLALLPMPDLEIWTTNDYDWDGARVLRVGLNLGAPGDRRQGKTLWLDVPSVGGKSPDLPVRIAPQQGIRWFYRHALRLPAGPAPRWVVGSGGEGLTSLRITLTREKVPEPMPYTVRLYFAEFAAIDPGERVFTVALQGRPVLRDLDVLREAGGRNRGLIKSVHGVRIGKELAVDFTPKRGKAILCGIQIVKE